MEKTYEVLGMSCVICKANVEKALNNIEGVDKAVVNLLENEVTVSFDDSKVSEKILESSVKDAGYTLVLNKEKKVNTNKLKLVFSIVLVIILMFISMNNSYPVIQLLICLIIILLNINLYISGLKSLIKLNPNMNSLVFISSIVSFIYSFFVLVNNSNNHLYFETSAMVLVIVSLGKQIEGNTKAKTVKVIRGLATLIPMQANLIKDGKIEIIKIEKLKKNDIVLVKAGESVPQDGIIIKGETSLDESMITGESLPVDKKIDDLVIGGTINTTGSIEVKITKSSNMTILSNIINLTKKATSEKIPVERLADKISKYFVFSIIIISIITLLVWLSITKNIELSLNFALSVLVISCPCALGLATPAAIAVAVGRSAKQGILIKKPEVLELIPNMKNIIFDKTGTLTKNELNIVDEEILDDSFISVLTSLEKTSNHPIAKTILSKYKEGTINFDESEFIPGKGIVAKLSNDTYYAGNDLLINIPSKYTDYARKNNYSYIAVTKNNKLLGLIYLTDILRDTSLLAINNLKKRNINSIMCTGDNEIAATKISKLLGINEYLSKVKPEDKNLLVEEKKKEGIVAMVGDGVNDSIALSVADVSISIKNASDIASATSDIVLMKNDLNDISYLYDLSSKTMRIIKQNLFWALGYNALMIPIAAGVFYKQGLVLNPMIGSLSMWISSMFVLGNALRINSVNKEEIKTMNKTVCIEGMMCKNCEKHAKQALEALGLDVKVVLEDKKAYIKNTSIDDKTIIEAIEDAGYEVSEIING